MMSNRNLNSSAYDDLYYKSVYNQHMQHNQYEYQLSSFWMYNAFTANNFSLENKKVLDFGCGPGHLTLSIAAECYDISPFIINKLETEGRIIFKNLNDIEDSRYDYVFSSHSLEHSVRPGDELTSIHRILKHGGSLFLILPLEIVPGNPVLSTDIHQHLYTWNFQTITNLLVYHNYKVILQDLIYGPTGLKLFKNNLSLARKLGRIKKHWPSLFTIAQKI